MRITSRSIGLFSQLLRSGGSELAHEQEVQKGLDVQELRRLGILTISEKTFPAVKLTLTLDLPEKEIELLRDVYTQNGGVQVKAANSRVSLSRIKNLKDLGYIQVDTVDGVASLLPVKF